MNVDTPFHHSFVPQGALDISDAEDVENSLDDNIDVSEHDGHLIQLEPLALEHFLVELPFAPSCESAGTSECSGVDLDKLNRGEDPHGGEKPEHPFHAALKKSSSSPNRRRKLRDSPYNSTFGNQVFLNTLLINLSPLRYFKD